MPSFAIEKLEVVNANRWRANTCSLAVHVINIGFFIQMLVAVINFKVILKRGKNMMPKIWCVTIFAMAIFSGPVFAEDWSNKSFSQVSAAAESGVPSAQHRLGWIYYFGYGVAESHAEAVRWWNQAAKQGYADAQYNLGMMFYIGHGVEQSYVEATRWLKLASEQGNSNAQATLGSMYYDGRGVAKNYAEALKWNRLAAQQGDPDAQSALGIMYAQGRGVELNYAQAYIWINVAVAQGDERARDMRDAIEKTLSQSVLNRAQQQSQLCIDSGYKDCGAQ